jgi:hypothetical protein
MAAAASNDRGLAREHEPRTLRAASEFEPRPSIADEELLTENARAREAAERRMALREMDRRLRAAEREIEAATRCLRTVDHKTRKDLARVRQAMQRIRERHAA